MRKIFAALCLALALCTAGAAQGWQEKLDAARGTTVRLVGWGGDPEPTPGSTAGLLGG